MNRVIRLKEWGCNKKTFKIPSEKQVAIATSGLEQKKYALTTNVNGFIVNGLDFDRSKRKEDIILLGDSFVESLFVDENNRMNAVIESLAPEVNVLNGGYSGATSLHLMNVIVNKVIPIKPSYVVVFIPTNDQRVQSLDHGYWNKDARLSPVVPLVKGDQLIDCYEECEHQKSIKKLLKSIHLLLKNYDISHCFATTPHRGYVDEHDEWLSKSGISQKRYQDRVNQRKMTNGACREFCKKNYLDLIDLELEVSDSNFFYDDLHLRNDSSRAVGRVLFDKLYSLGVL